ncbi:MAG TPA: chemotaxis protein CheW [Mycobacteriales bacterium]|nr:chemotaxis protein CheW [Mycobacteriales bacterium]
MTTTTSAGYVLFLLSGRRFAAPLDEIREIVRLTGLESLPGAEPPLAGVINLRGVPLPVLDVRAAGSTTHGDVLVMTVDGDAVGVAVDEVCAVLSPDDLPDGEAPAKTLPSYVVGVRRHDGNPVLLVDLRRML